MLTMQKNGLTNATDDLEGQKVQILNAQACSSLCYSMCDLADFGEILQEDEYKMIETLETESKHLREIVKVQKAALEQQAQMLETQRQEVGIYIHIHICMYVCL